MHHPKGGHSLPSALLRGSLLPLSRPIGRGRVTRPPPSSGGGSFRSRREGHSFPVEPVPFGGVARSGQQPPGHVYSSVPLLRRVLPFPRAPLPRKGSLVAPPPRPREDALVPGGGSRLRRAAALRGPHRLLLGPPPARPGAAGRPDRRGGAPGAGAAEAPEAGPRARSPGGAAMAGCCAVLAAFLFEYDTPRIVLIRSRKVGLMNRAVQLLILAYVIG